MKIRVLGLLAILAAAVNLQGCASGASMQGMTYEKAAASVVMQGQVAVAPVKGGKDTNPMWVSQVSSEAFEGALKASLLKAGMLSQAGQAPLTLEANLVSLKQPMFGLDMTVTATVAYQLKDANGKVLMLETIATPYTATVGDAFVAVKRLRLANEGAIRKNIETLIGKLEKLNLQQVGVK